MCFERAGAAGVFLFLGWTAITSAQTASISIRSLTIEPQGEQFRTFAGDAQTFTPQGDNTFVVNPPVDARNRTAPSDGGG